MTFMIPALQSADTFPQAKACAPRRCGGGKVSAGWGYLLLSRRGSPFRFRWLCLGVRVALFCRAVGSHGAVFTYLFPEQPRLEQEPYRNKLRCLFLTSGLYEFLSRGHRK